MFPFTTKGVQEAYAYITSGKVRGKLAITIAGGPLAINDGAAAAAAAGEDEKSGSGAGAAAAAAAEGKGSETDALLRKRTSRS